MKYRYITSGIVNMTDPVSIFRLIGTTNMGGSMCAIRIEIPDDMKLEKWDCDPYSTTSDPRTIAELHPVACIRKNGRMCKGPDELIRIQPHEWHNYLLDKYDLRITEKGFVTRETFKKMYY